MSNLPTLPPTTGPERTLTPLTSSALSVESNTRLQAALAASARAEASLSGLSRTIQHLGADVGGAREANESLTTEFEALRDMLCTADEQLQFFQVKIEQLELVLDRTRKEHRSERSYLIEQHDLFLVKLLDGQEVELKRRDADIEVFQARLLELERRQIETLPPPFATLQTLRPQAVQRVEPSSSSSPPSSELERAERAELERAVQKLADDCERARETVSRLQAQRDDAQIAVAQISQERDEALHQIHRLKAELGGPRLPMSTHPPPSNGDAGRDPAQARPLGAARTLDQLEAEARTNRPTAPAGPPDAPTNSNNEPLTNIPVISVLSPPPSDPNATPLSTRLSPSPTRLSQPQLNKHSSPPEELRRALTAQSSASSQPPLKQKPDASTRPLVGYSVGNDSIQPELLEGARLSSKPVPPGSGKR